jgi:ATP-dependent RNA helicase RhlE
MRLTRAADRCGNGRAERRHVTTTSFAAFGLAEPLTRGLARAGFDTPTPIQAQAIAPQLAGRDILGIAQTGTGKTAAFALPILHQLLALGQRPAPRTCRALVLAPTRELAVQIEASFRALAGGARLSTLLVLGGTSRSAQVRALARGVDVLVATPGRLTDLMDDGSVRLDQTRFVVLDEADRMLDMGFIQPVRRIVAALHPRRQSALFSATMPAEVAGLAQGFLKVPVRIEVAPQATTVERIDQRVEPTEAAAKRPRLVELVTAAGVGRTIVFARTKRGADRVAQNLVKDGVAAEVIHGNKAQNARQRALGAFRNGQVRVLVATDIVARGIDVPGVTHVINYDLPDEPEAYVHRIGRTGRNGADGTAITLCAPDELKKLRAVEKLIRVTLLPGGDPRPQAKPAHRQPVHARKPAQKPLDPARAERARNRRPRRTRKAA